MNDALIGTLGFYGMVTVFISLFGVIQYTDARGPVPRRKGARMMFGAPLWPVVGVIIAARNIRAAWRDTGWGKP